MSDACSQEMFCVEGRHDTDCALTKRAREIIRLTRETCSHIRPHGPKTPDRVLICEAHLAQALATPSGGNPREARILDIGDRAAKIVARIEDNTWGRAYSITQIEKLVYEAIQAHEVSFTDQPQGSVAGGDPRETRIRLFAEKWRWFLKDGEKWHEAFLADVAALSADATGAGAPREAEAPRTMPTAHKDGCAWTAGRGWCHCTGRAIFQERAPRIGGVK